MTCLLDKVVDEIPGPDIDESGDLQMLVTTLDWSEYVGPNVFRPIQRGDQHLQIPGLINIRTGDFIHHLVQQACHILRPDRMV